MSTQSANEATTSRLTTHGARTSHPRPHLVPRTDQRVQPENVVVVAAVEGDALDFEARRINGSELLLSSAPHSTAFHRTTAVPPRRLSKRTLDVVGALGLALVFSPLILAIILIMRTEDGGPIIFRHRRVGRGERSFECLKFRTMVPNADQVLQDLLERDPELKAEWVRDHKLRNDPRITRLGRFLRRTSLDELPQIWNVLRGEMSLVGPRPIVREELLRYGRSVGTYLSAKPGITGLWQVKGRNDTDYRRRVALDTYYVRNQSLTLDVYILFKTTLVVLGGNGAY